MQRLSQRRGRSMMDRRTFITGAAASAAIACSRTAMSPGSAATPTKGVVTTNDGVTLRYEEAGSGKPLVCIPGWSQTAAQFKHQLTGLSDRYRVTADPRRWPRPRDVAGAGIYPPSVSDPATQLAGADRLQPSGGFSGEALTKAYCRRGVDRVVKPTLQTRRQYAAGLLHTHAPQA